MRHAGLFLLIFSALSSALTITDGTDEGMAAFVITTQRATYYYQKDAGGFSSIVDNQGNDWVSHNSTYGSNASSEYRGLPNFVAGSSDAGAGHPGFDLCTSTQQGANTIATTRKSGLWQWTWNFFETYAQVTMQQVDPGHTY